MYFLNPPPGGFFYGQWEEYGNALPKNNGMSFASSLM
jgi:hypothetical protein